MSRGQVRLLLSSFLSGLDTCGKAWRWPYACQARMRWAGKDVRLVLGPLMQCSFDVVIIAPFPCVRGDLLTPGMA